MSMGSMAGRCFLFGVMGALAGSIAWAAEPQIPGGVSPIAEPYPYVRGGSFSGPAVSESPDPLVAYRWPNPQVSDSLEIYLQKPKAISCDRPESFVNLDSLTGERPDVTVRGAGSIRFDFGAELPAWVEFDSPDCPGGVEMSISEYNEPGFEKTKAPVKHGNTFRLELNSELYEGVRFAWIHVKSAETPWHITGIRAVCQTRPVNYNGSFSCSDPMLTKVWYMSAYSVRVCLGREFLGAILMNRGDRISWTGDAHPSQAAALVAFGNYDFIKRNLDHTANQNNGIKSYPLYWVLSLLDYFWYTGEAGTLDASIDNACAKLDSAYKEFGTNPSLGFYGWDERLGAGAERSSCPESQRAYQMLSIRVWSEFARAMGERGRIDLRDKYEGYAAEKLAPLRHDGAWHSAFGLHAAADAVNTGRLSPEEKKALVTRFVDRATRVTFSPFNGYFILQAMARLNRIDDALVTINDQWGGMIRYGGTTTFENSWPSWADALGKNDPVPNCQSGYTSLCHPWGAGPVKWLNEEVLGIKPTAPGFKTFDVLPRLGRSLRWVAGKTPTPSGAIRARFDVGTGTCLVSAPMGTVGRIGIPKVERMIRRIKINGEVAWDGRFQPVNGIGGATEDADYVYFTAVQPGAYAFDVSYRGRTPAWKEPAMKYAARFVKRDTATQGNWGGVYGKDGYLLCGYDQGKDRKSLPSYVTSVEYYRWDARIPQGKVWANETTDRAALAPDSSNSLPRVAACFCNNYVSASATIHVEGTKDFQVALYFVDWGDKGLSHMVEMFDADTLNPIAPVQRVKDFAGGVWLVYSYNKSVKFRIDNVRGDMVTLSGIFFDGNK